MIKYCLQLRWECAVRDFSKPPKRDGKDLRESRRKVWEKFREHQMIQVYIYKSQKCLIKVRSAILKSEVQNLKTFYFHCIYRGI